jgi:hypothetical protein
MTPSVSQAAGLAVPSENLDPEHRGQTVLVDQAAPQASVASPVPLSEPCATDPSARPVRLSDAADLSYAAMLQQAWDAIRARLSVSHAAPADLHAAILNLPDTKSLAQDGLYRLAYQAGHRDARHAAADLVSPAAAKVSEAYTDAIGLAGTEYHAQFPHAWPLPALWRWEELWNAMFAAARAAVSAVDKPPELQGQPVDKSAQLQGQAAAKVSEAAELSVEPRELDLKCSGDFAHLAPSSWDADYRNLWLRCQVAEQNKMVYRREWLAALAAPASQVSAPPAAPAGAAPQKPSVQMTRQSYAHSWELWLMVRDENGCFKPLGDTGPIRMPNEWSAALATQQAEGQQ